MKRVVSALVPWMVLATAAQGGQTRFADVLYTHLDEVPTRALRIGDECFVATSDVTRWGWTVNVSGDSAEVAAEGKTFRIATRVLNGRTMLPMRVAVAKLGARADWSPGTDTLEVWSDLGEVRVEAARIVIRSGLNFRVQTTMLANPSRLVVDLRGVRISPATTQALGERGRLVQHRPNTARLIVETEFAPDPALIPTRGVSEIDLSLTNRAPSLPEPVETLPETKPTLPVAPLPPPNERIQLQIETSRRISLRLPVGASFVGPAEVRTPDPLTVDVFLPGAEYPIPTGYKLDTPNVVAVTSASTADGTLITFQLRRPMTAEVATQAGVVIVAFEKPAVSDGHLAGKIIVVDPGHGGADGGSRSAGVREKTLNLTIGKLIAEALQREGATVIMTRKTDVAVKLERRAQMANQAGADLFISTHINSTAPKRQQSGTITFHHLGQTVSRLLAQCIQREIVKVNKLPDLGVWSDGRIYNTGFAVLRLTTMPGVLLELGFINHPRDRARMVQPEFQKAIAAAVVRGIKVFLGDAETKK